MSSFVTTVNAQTCSITSCGIISEERIGEGTKSAHDRCDCDPCGFACSMDAVGGAALRLKTCHHAYASVEVFHLIADFPHSR